jgi:hypothetical protein
LSHLSAAFIGSPASHFSQAKTVPAIVGWRFRGPLHFGHLSAGNKRGIDGTLGKTWFCCLSGSGLNLKWTTHKFKRNHSTKRDGKGTSPALLQALDFDLCDHIHPHEGLVAATFADLDLALDGIACLQCLSNHLSGDLYRFGFRRPAVGTVLAFVVKETVASLSNVKMKIGHGLLVMLRLLNNPKTAHQVPLARKPTKGHYAFRTRTLGVKYGKYQFFCHVALFQNGVAEYRL